MNGIWGIVAGTVIPSLFIFVGYLCRHSLSEYITSGIRHSFEREIEVLHADLQKKENEISAIRSNMLLELSNRRSLLTTRRIQAVEKIWADVVLLDKHKMAAIYLSSMNIDNVNKEIETNRDLRKLFEVISSGTNLSTASTSEAAKQRPFVPPQVWALFGAYSTIILTAVAKLQALGGGMKIDGMFNEKGIIELLKAALPHRSGDIDRLGLKYSHLFLDEVQQALLSELAAVLDGKDEGQKATEQTIAILDSITKVQAHRVQAELAQST